MKNDPAAILYDNKINTLSCTGNWTINQISSLQKKFAELTFPPKSNIMIDGAQIEKMDTAGAWYLAHIIELLKTRDKDPDANVVKTQNLTLSHQKLLSLALNNTQKTQQDFEIVQRKSNWINAIGFHTLHSIKTMELYLNFIGRLCYDVITVWVHPRYLRWRSFASVIFQNGFNALPIIGFLSFMIGVVLAYQMGLQLKNYGANLFVVDLIGFSVLREFGPLITAIMVAGRTGSAFTAHLGTMSVNQEIDALNTMGITPSQLLILPRIAALIIILPLLTIWSDFFAVMGGMLMANNVLGITPHEFLSRFQQQIPLRALLIGIGKAPIFGLIIATIGCFEGMMVKRNAESIGLQTTRSVVLSIFLIITVNAIFSILLSRLRL